MSWISVYSSAYIIICSFAARSTRLAELIAHTYYLVGWPHNNYRGDDSAYMTRSRRHSNTRIPPSPLGREREGDRRAYGERRHSWAGEVGARAVGASVAASKA